MNVIINTRTKPNDCKYELVSVENAFSRADVLSIHCPLTEQTKEIVCEKNLSLMKKDALLINTARGGIVNEHDLAYALDNELIAGAALDVLCEEPMSENTPLKNAKNCIITPHTAWAPLETRLRLIDIVCSNIRAFIDGNPTNKVN
jgi:glycerate dehydrogenase